MVTRIHRVGADKRRRKSLAGIPTKKGFDRDEWPMPMARKAWRTHVMYVPARQNRSVDAKVGGRLRAYCDGAKFTIAAKR